MKIAKIKNHYMFKSNNPYGTHDWLIWKDRKTGETRAVELTHLYNKDPKRFAQLKAGLLKKMNFKHRETPSGVGNSTVTRMPKAGQSIPTVDLSTPMFIESRGSPANKPLTLRISLNSRTQGRLQAKRRSGNKKEPLWGATEGVVINPRRRPFPSFVREIYNESKGNANAYRKEEKPPYGHRQ